MPIPNKRTGESKQDFISRCAGDPVMVKEFPDQKQRLATCYSRWGEKKAKATYVVQAEGDEYIFSDEDIETA